ncbi:conjugal transfer protein TraW [Caballeronia sp. EK]|uniref:conjugal transfer protein TraW n=1 Tax=Caballeronia sp. EK TaxID=2767469 RepID=UPI001654FABB|nr:conjugal transfer protein TraW [Caballeronia sp. EK]MBC8641600.1 conjugal transfer protein TraW [Caballeronia sp. EK]
MKKQATLTALAAAALFSSSSAYAVCDGCVVGAVGTAATSITSALGAGFASLSTLLTTINGNIGGVGAKTASSMIQAANTQREMGIEIQRQQEQDRIARETELPIDPCSTSGSNYANQAIRGAGATSSSYRRGGGSGTASVSSSVLGHALSDAAPSAEASRRASTAIHQQKYCSALEVRLGYPGCGSSSMPDADAQAESIFTGAGQAGKTPDLTFTKDQEEAARAYTRLSLDPQPPENISRAEAATESGKLYIAMQKAYQANMSAAEKAQNDETASHMPFANSASLIEQIKQSDAAAQYFNATASNVAKSTGQMSLAELLDFEAGRRWRNPYWVIEQSAVSDPTKLQREQLMTTAFIAELQYENLKTNKFNSVVLGQILASLTRSNDRPAIESQLQRVRATNAR